MVAPKQDANLVGFYKARELSLGKLPAAPIFKTREPNSFKDFGGAYTQVARKPFSPSRQRKKGQTTDLDADGGYNEDVTQNNMQGDMEEFMFAAIHKLPEIDVATDGFNMTWTANAGTDVGTTAAPHGLATGDGPFYVTAGTTPPAGLAINTPYWLIVTGASTFKLASTYAHAFVPTPIDLTDTGTGTLRLIRQPAVDTASDEYVAKNITGVVVGDILFASGFAQAANNGLKHVTSVVASKVGVSENLADEATPPYGATVKVVGHTFAVGDLALTLHTGGFSIVTTAADFLDYNLVPGSWLFIGGDGASAAFVDATPLPNPGYARIALDGISADGKTIMFDKSTFVPVAGDGTGLTIPVYFSEVVKNEDDPDLIVRFSTVIERTLGRDDDGVQSEQLTGAVANELTWNSAQAALVSVDMTYIAQRADDRTGAQQPLAVQAGARIIKALGESAFNTSSNVFRQRMAAVDPVTLNPLPIFARITEYKATLKNNVKSAKAQGVLGGFDTITGMMEVDLTVTAYFTTTDAIHAVKCNRDMTFDSIYAKDNAGLYQDYPLLSLGGGRLTIEQDAAIMLPLTGAAAESPFGHTMLMGWFNYLPTVGMPDVDC